MAQMAGAGGAMFAGATILDMVNSIQQGRAAEDQGDFMKRVYNNIANEREAASQRQALQVNKQTEQKVSRARAVAAASGAGADDPTVQDIIVDLETEGEMAALSRLYEGGAQARDARTFARMADIEGENAERNAYADAAGTLLGGASTLYGRYGKGFKGSVGRGLKINKVNPNDVDWDALKG